MTQNLTEAWRGELILARASLHAAVRREQILSTAVADALAYLADDDPGLASTVLNEALVAVTR